MAQTSVPNDQPLALLERAERKKEEPTGASDLLQFYNLLRLYERLGKPGSYRKLLTDTSFSNYAWHRGELASLAPLGNPAKQPSRPTIIKPISQSELQAFTLQPGKFILSEADKGPPLDTSALGDTVPSGEERDKRKKERKDKEVEKKDKSKKQKKEKHNKGEKRKRSEEKQLKSKE